jgi:hypothetical protein
MKLQNVENALLFIEPSSKIKESDMSEYIWLVELFKYAKRGCGEIMNNEWTCDQYMGAHQCRCGKRSESRDFLFSNNMFTNSLCLHYLQWHRDEIPEIEFEKLKQLKNNLEFKSCTQCKNFSSTITGRYKRCLKCRTKSKKYKS